MSNVRPRRFGIIGHTGLDGGMGLAAMLALSLAMHSKSHASGAPRQLSTKEIAEQDKRSERQRWNDEVAKRKAQKKLAKIGAQS